VRVNAVNPSSIATERLESRIRTLACEQGIDEAAARKRMAEALGVVRFGAPEEIAAVVAFLASSVSSYCQGTIVDVDGGKTRTL
jgi:3-oxoacyl-[acyl-carrier protein] reductase